MKWYEDLMVWLVLLIILVAFTANGYMFGKRQVEENCRNYGAHMLSSNEGMLCFIKPILPNNSGEKAYIPEAREFFKKGKDT